MQDRKWTAGFQKSSDELLYEIIDRYEFLYDR